jgi:hypothetical protein
VGVDEEAADVVVAEEADDSGCFRLRFEIVGW